MRTVGLCVSIQNSKPSVACVVTDGTQGQPNLVTSFDLKTDASSLPGQIDDLAKALSSKIGALEVDVAVVRLADISPTGTRKAGPRIRLLIEGALTLVCERHTTSSVKLRTGKEVGEAMGISKAEALTAGQQLDSKRADASAAALSGLPKDVERGTLDGGRGN
jgi:hypothetical protein